MEVGRLELINVVHQEVIGKIFVDVRVKMKSVGIDEGCDGAEKCNPGEGSNALGGANFFQSICEASIAKAQPAPHRANPVNCEQDEADEKATVQIHPEQHRHWEEPEKLRRSAKNGESSPFEASIAVLRRIQYPEPQQSEEPS